MTTSVEFAVQMTCESCVSKIETSLKGVEGIKSFKISKENGTVLVDSNLPSAFIQEKIESTGRKAVLKGCGDESGNEEEISSVKTEFKSSGLCSKCNSLESGNKKGLKKSTVTNTNKKSKANEETTVEQNEGSENDSDQPVKKKSKLESESISKSEDEEELELKYSSDSEDEDLENQINAEFQLASGGEDIWKMYEDFNVIDADGDDVEDSIEQDKDDDKSEDDEKSPGKSSAPGRKRKITCLSDDVHESDDDHKTVTEKDNTTDTKSFKTQANERYINNMTSAAVRRGDFNISNQNLNLQVIIEPENEGNTMNEDEAQLIKDSICKELFKRGHQLRRGELGVTQLRFSDCKLIKPGLLLITCDNKDSFDWLMNWKIPSKSDNQFRCVPAVEKAPKQMIKFSLRPSLVPDEQTMLRLIHMQNKDIITKRWVLKEKKPVGKNMDQYKYEVDSATHRILQKYNWSFFYELFSVRITEVNGKPIRGNN